MACGSTPLLSVMKKTDTELELLITEHRLLTMRRNTLKKQIKALIEEMGEIKIRRNQIDDEIWEHKHGRPDDGVSACFENK